MSSDKNLESSTLAKMSGLLAFHIQGRSRSTSSTRVKLKSIELRNDSTVRQKSFLLSLLIIFGSYLVLENVSGFAPNNMVAGDL